MQVASDDEESERVSSDDWDSGDEFSEDRCEEDARDVPVEVGPIDEESFQLVTKDAGVRKSVVRPGQSGKSPQEGDSIFLKYVLRLGESEEIVDVSQNDMWLNKEFKFVAGSTEVMQGLNEAVLSMERDEVARFLIRCDYGFGAEGSPPKIPPKADLILDAELMSFRQPFRDKLFLRQNEIMPYVLDRKAQGNAKFGAKDYPQAMHDYKSCLKCISMVDEEPYLSDLKPVRIQILGNLAAAHLALGNWQRVIKYTTELLQTDMKNEKALFRRAKARRQYSEHLEDARHDLAECIRINPRSKQFREEYESLVAEIKEKQGSAAQAYGANLFSDKIYENVSRAYFELAQGKTLLGRVEMELFVDRVPRTCENFLQLCSGEKGFGYAKSILHRVIEGFLIQGGDVTGKSGTGGKSIYGSTFDDENFSVKSNRPWTLCMANTGPNTNQSQFFITLTESEDFQGKYVAFGRVVGGRRLLKRVEACQVDDDDRPVKDIQIYKCGVLRKADPMLDSSDDEKE